ncbi:MAG: DUF2269 family protein [Clostridia bacterium]|nr:DUF2269 family protein [Clostridia bacterium]
MYALALFLHVVGVGLLFAADAVDYAVVMQMRRAGTNRDLAALLPVSRLVRPLHAASGALVLLPGLYMAWAAWGWTTGWIDVSTAAFAVTAVVGRAVLAPRFAAVERKLASAGDGAPPEGALDPEVGAQARDPSLVLWVHVLGFWLFAFLYLMVLKPGWLGSLAALAVASAAGWAVGRALLAHEEARRAGGRRRARGTEGIEA